MTLTQSIITIAAVVLGTMLTRFLPFLIFPEGKKPPQYITYLGMVLPHAVIGLLVVYCLKDALTGSYHAAPEILAILFPAPQMEKEHTHEYRRRHCIIYVSAPKLFSLSLSLQTKTGAITK